MDENSHKKELEKEKNQTKISWEGAIFLDDNFPGGNFPEGIIARGIFPRTKKYLFVVKCLQFLILDNPCPFLVLN